MNEQKNKSENRIGGLAAIIVGAGIGISNHLLLKYAGNILLDIGGAMFVAEGTGDLITGKHHYVATKITNYINERRNIKYLL